MAQYGLSITKSVNFRGVAQEFSNVYHFAGDLASPAEGTGLVNAVKALEVPLHSTDVSFLRYSVWTSGGSVVANQMLVQGNLSGTGDQGTNASMDRERAVLVRFAAGLDTRGRPVFLRKWYHSCGAVLSLGFSAGNLQNTAEIVSTTRTAIENHIDNLLTLSANSKTYNLVAESGRAAGTPVTCHRYLEHHQLGDMWR